MVSESSCLEPPDEFEGRRVGDQSQLRTSRFEGVWESEGKSLVHGWFTRRYWNVIRLYRRFCRMTIRRQVSEKMCIVCVHVCVLCARVCCTCACMCVVSVWKHLRVTGELVTF